MAVARGLTFESGSLVNAADGFDSINGANIALTTVSPIVGTYSVDLPSLSNENGTITYTASDTIYVAMKAKIRTLPAGSRRIIQIKDTGGSTICGLVVSFSGSNITIRIQDGTTSVGSTQTLATGVGDIIWVGLRYTKGTGANGVVEGYYAADGAAFGAAFASTTTSTKTVQTDRVTIGNTTGSALDMEFDYITVSDSAIAQDILTVGAVTVSDYADCMAAVTATFSNDQDNNRTVTLAHSTDGSSWTTDVETTTAYTNGTSATGHVTGLTPNTSYYVRAVFTNPSGVFAGGITTGYLGGTTSPGNQSLTTLAQLPLTPTRGLYAGARPAWFSNAPAASTSNDTASTIDGCEWISWMKGQDNTMLSTLRADGYASAVFDYRLCYEIRFGTAKTTDPYVVDGSTNDGGTANANSWAWDTTTADMWEAALRADETMFLHATSATAANRLGTSVSNLLDPGHSKVRELARKSAVLRHMATAANSVTANQRRHAAFFDNVDAASTTRGAGTPFEYALAGNSRAWSDAMAGLIDAVTATGIRVVGNMTGASTSTSTIDTLPRRDLVDRIFTHMDGGLYEWVFANYTSQMDATYTITRTSTGDAAVSGTDGYHEPVDFEAFLKHLDIMMGRGANVSGWTGTYPYPADFVVVGVGQLYDNNKNDTVADLSCRYGWGMWMLATDSQRQQMYHRQADSSNSGYGRLRKPTGNLWDTDTGNPLDVWQSDALSGNAALTGSTTIKRVKYRRFAQGCLVMNCSVETAVPYDLSAVNDPNGTAYGTGTLGKFEVKWIAASAPAGGVSAALLRNRRRVGRALARLRRGRP